MLLRALVEKFIELPSSVNPFTRTDFAGKFALGQDEGLLIMEAEGGIEPPYTALQAAA